MTQLERLRVRSNLTIQQLADKSGIPPRTIRELETGKIRKPRLSTYAPLAQALDVDPADLAEWIRADAEAVAA